MPPVSKLKAYTLDKGQWQMKEHYTSFNSTVEIGTRIALIVSVLESKNSLDELVILDYALLYSEEFGGPENLHPALPNHIAEISHRREVMPEAINMLLKRGLIDLIIERSGHYYKGNKATHDFVSCLQSTYYKKSWIRLNWLSENKHKVVKTKLTDLTKNLS